MSQLNEVIKNFLFAASLKPDDTLISKVVSAKRLLYINLGAEVDRYPYSTAVATEITCKEMLIAVDRQRLIQASGSSMSAAAGANKALPIGGKASTSTATKKYNPKEYVQRLYTFRNVLKKTMTTDKLFTLLHHSHHVLPAALVENTQQSLSMLFEALDHKDPFVANTNESTRTATPRRRTEDEETVLTSISRAEYFCAGIFCEAKRRPELGALLKLEQLTELAEVQADAFRNAAKILMPLLQTYVYADTAKAQPTTSSSSSSSAAPSSSTKRRTVAPDEVLDFDDDNDSYGILAVAVDSVDGGDSESATTGSKSTNSHLPHASATGSTTAVASSTLGKRNLQAFLQSDRRRHLAELAYQQQQQKDAASAASRAQLLKGEDDEETKRQRQLLETQRWRLLYEIWRESVSQTPASEVVA